MKIRFPKNELFEKFLATLFYEKIEDYKVLVGYNGFFEVQITRKELETNRNEFARFAGEIKVNGGTKKTKGNLLVIAPVRKDAIGVRLPLGYQYLLGRVAEKLGVRPSDYARLALLTRVHEILKAIEQHKMGARMRSVKPLKTYRSDKPVEARPLIIRLSSDEKAAIMNLIRDSDQPLSGFIRTVLESNLLNTGRELGLLVPVTKQTSESSATRGG